MARLVKKLWGCLVVAATVGAVFWAHEGSTTATPTPPPRVLARVMTFNGGIVMGHLLPIPNCPKTATCADPWDYASQPYDPPDDEWAQSRARRRRG